MIQVALDNHALSAGEALLLKKAVGESPVLVCVPTNTQVDVGLWFRWRRLKLCLCAGRAVLLADGPRPFCQSVGYDQLGTAFYSHRSGELVLLPAPLLTVRSLSVWPDDGWMILKKIKELSGAGPGNNKPNSTDSKDSIHASTSA